MTPLNPPVKVIEDLPWDETGVASVLLLLILGVAFVAVRYIVSHLMDKTVETMERGAKLAAGSEARIEKLEAAIGELQRERSP